MKNLHRSTWTSVASSKIRFANLNCCIKNLTVLVNCNYREFFTMKKVMAQNTLQTKLHAAKSLSAQCHFLLGLLATHNFLLQLLKSPPSPSCFQWEPRIPTIYSWLRATRHLYAKDCYPTCFIMAPKINLKQIHGTS